MVKYDEIERINRKQGLIMNRCSVLNQLLGASWDGDPHRPLRVTLRRGTYVATFYGEGYATWRAYDEGEVDAAFARIDALGDGVWLALRSRRVALV